MSNLLAESVIMPREDFLELSEAAWNQPTPTLGQRAATTVQTTLFCAALAGAVAAASWGWATAVEWHEQRSFERARAAKENGHNPKYTP